MDDDDARALADEDAADPAGSEPDRPSGPRRTLLQVAIIGGALLLIAVIVGAVLFTSGGAAPVDEPTRSPASADTAAPVEVSGDRVRVGVPGAPVTLSIYEDFSCPHCKAYEAMIGDTLAELIAGGQVAVEFHPIRIVSDYGVRAGSTAACVAVDLPERWLEVRSELFAIQDPSTDGWGYDELRGHLAEQGIADAAVLDCVSEGRYAGWIDQNTAVARDAGITSTPTLLIDGESSELLSAEQLRATVNGLL